MRTAILAVAIALAAFPAAGGPERAAAEKAGDVVLVRGRAQIERTTGAVPARIREALRESDSVTTKRRSRVKMLFRDDSILTLGSNSRLVIRKYLYDPRNRRAESLYELADGKLRSVAGGTGFKVTTPTAFAAARGTLFTVSYDAETGTTAITVTEGAVEVRNVDPGVTGVQIVHAGESTTVKAHEPPAPPVPFTGGASDDDGKDLPEFEAEDESGNGLLHEFRREFEKAGFGDPIEREPAHTTTKTTLDLRFR